MLNNKTIEATLKYIDTLEVAIKKSIDSSFVEKMRLFENEKLLGDLECVSKSESKSSYIYTFQLNYPIVPGRLYSVADGKNEFSYVNISMLGSSDKIEREYRYDGELGAIYTKEFTTFRLFSPLASEVNVRIMKKDNKIEILNMTRIDGGVFEAKADGDFEGTKYRYIARLNGEYISAVDPYAKSLDANSRNGYVVDMEKLNDIDLNSGNLPEFENATKSIIYECSVRDMTSLTNIEDKCTYNALARENQVDEKNNPIGLDYIANLGISHVQLMPVYDFQTVDDNNPQGTYNWGYDPEFYFAPEGSYSSNPDDPYSRMRELRNLVASFHKKGIRVNMDVVFNHVFRMYSNSLQLLCPNYYFRFNEDGTISNGSGCGNDIESRRYMTRKLIVDSLRLFIKYYGMDGYRFDLIGILDIDTVKLAYHSCKQMQPDLMFYGEGWDLATNLPSVEKTNLNNAKKFNDVGFFNDRFRDITKGHTYGENMNGKGYLSGDSNYIDGFKHVFLASVISLSFPSLFNNPRQSINYVECHDNGTLFDKLKKCCPNESQKTILKRVKLINAVTILSFGVPFIHAGQEFGASKNGDTNSYISGDNINGFDYKKAYERAELIEFLKECIKLKKSTPYFISDDKKEIENNINFKNIEHGAIVIEYFNESIDKKIIAIINPTNVTVKYNFEKYYKIIFNEAGFDKGENYSQLLLVNGVSIVVAVSS